MLDDVSGCLPSRWSSHVRPTQAPSGVRLSLFAFSEPAVFQSMSQLPSFCSEPPSPVCSTSAPALPARSPALRSPALPQLANHSSHQSLFLPFLVLALSATSTRLPQHTLGEQAWSNARLQLPSILVRLLRTIDGTFWKVVERGFEALALWQHCACELVDTFQFSAPSFGYRADVSMTDHPLYLRHAQPSHGCSCVCTILSTYFRS